MANNDDEYKRRRHDKFRGERGYKSGSRTQDSSRDDSQRRGDDWSDRGRATLSNRDRGSSRQEYSTEHSCPRDRYSQEGQDMSTPMKRMRTESYETKMAMTSRESGSSSSNIAQLDLEDTLKSTSTVDNENKDSEDELDALFDVIIRCMDKDDDDKKEDDMTKKYDVKKEADDGTIPKRQFGPEGNLAERNRFIQNVQPFHPPTTPMVERDMRGLNKLDLKKLFIIGDVMWCHQDVMAQFISIPHEGRSFASISPHEYYVFDEIRCANVKDYVEVIVEARPSYTWNGMLSEHYVLERWAESKPGCTILGLGLSDVKLENVILGHEPDNCFYNMLEECLRTMKMVATGSRSPAKEFWHAHTFIVLELPNWEAVRPEQFVGTDWQDWPPTPRHNISESEYKQLKVKINKMLQKKRDYLFFNYNVLIVKPLTLEGVAGTCSGLPRSQKVLEEYYKNILSVAARVICHKGSCTMRDSSRRSRVTMHTAGCGKCYPQLGNQLEDQ